jgi:hypothetical protein
VPNYPTLSWYGSSVSCIHATENGYNLSCRSSCPWWWTSEWQNIWATKLASCSSQPVTCVCLWSFNTIMALNGNLWHDANNWREKHIEKQFIQQNFWIISILCCICCWHLWGFPYFAGFFLQLADYVPIVSTGMFHTTVCLGNSMNWCKP